MLPEDEPKTPPTLPNEPMIKRGNYKPPQVVVPPKTPPPPPPSPSKPIEPKKGN